VVEAADQDVVHGLSMLAAGPGIPCPPHSPALPWGRKQRQAACFEERRFPRARWNFRGS
jgi:hypothetical protein